jgi:hypothetical protein
LSCLLSRRLTRSILSLPVAAALAPVAAQALSFAPLASSGAMPPAPWQVQGLPKQTMPMTRFALVDLDGKRALRIEADRSYGNLVHPLSPGVTSSFNLAWQWRVDQPLTADLRTKAGDDTAVKVCVFFDLALDKIPFGERQLLRLARARTQGHLPGATVCYVWDDHLPADTALPNPYTGRMRYLVLRSGPANPPSWRTEQRDVAADFARLFGDESAQMPPVIGIAIGADADNTAGRSLAYIADLVLTR